MKKLKFNKLPIRKKFRLILSIYKKLNKRLSKNLKFKKYRLLSKKQRVKIFIKKLTKHYPKLVKNFKLKKLNFNINSKIKFNRIKIKKNFKNDNKFLTKRFKRFLVNFPQNDNYINQKYRLQKKLAKMSNIKKKTKSRRNLSKRTYFFKIMRKSRRRKIKLVRLNRLKPIFTKKTKKEKKFLLKSRESLLKTKKFLYRKQFPKIKGKKNKNFNFFYYNNMERLPLKFHIGRIVITYLLNNTFINIHNSKKMLKVLSAGKVGFKGPKRSTAYSRQIVARKAIKYVAKTKLNVLDIFLNSNYNRWYYFIFKEINKLRIKPFVIRYLVISNSRPHGFIRDRKHRRK